MAALKATKILVIASEKSTQNLMKNTLKGEGYSVYAVSPVEKALKLFKKNNFEIAVYDLKPTLQYRLREIKRIKSVNPEILIIAIINTPSYDVIRRVLKSGVYGYLINPFNLEEFLFMVKNAVKFVNLVFANRALLKETGESRAHLEKQTVVLEKEGNERVRTIDKLYKDLQDTYMRTIKTLIHAIDARDHYTHNHSRNVTRYAVSIAKKLNLSQKEIEQIREACALHDLGKIAIHDYILTKPGKLTAKEWSQMKTHSLKGAEILSPLGFLDGVIDLIRQHHERYDGKGYPDGIKGENISLGARIMSAADAYDAMISRRPYKKRPLTKQETVAELKKNSGTQFDPMVVKAFLQVIKGFKKTNGRI